MTRSLRSTWQFWVYFLVVGFMSGRETETSRMSGAADLLVGLIFSLLVAFWVALDARRRERGLSYGFPSLVFILWPVFAPIYLFQTRGLKAFWSLTLFSAMMFVTVGVGAIIGVETK